MKYYLLASGSKGNCFVLQEGAQTLVVDCGTTKKYLQACFDKIGVDPKSVDGLLITHEHSDHISQLKMFDGVDVYAPISLETQKYHEVKASIYFNIGDIKVTPLPLSHDAKNTTGYIFETKKEKLVYITDTGYINTSYLGAIVNADYIVMESNHDIEMLMNTNRPPYLKKRIYSDSGHLNNEACAETLAAIVSKKTKQIILGHISQEANTMEKALEVTVSTLKNSEHAEIGDDLIINAAGQYEIIAGGVDNEKDSHSSCCCTFGMEHLSNG